LDQRRRTFSFTGNSYFFIPSIHPSSLLSFLVSCCWPIGQERVARPASLRPRWHKPSTVLKVLNPRTVVILDHLGNNRTVSIDNLKPTSHQNGTTNDTATMDHLEKNE
uniref:Putative uncharacterized protein S1 n=1 Tax=Human spumaretrovirus TaxID=11963 RepID=S1_FOAMV|nr:RecName: Full=Putative uncharacterized protein S1 [Human spumaretrovirus]pir/WMLJSP/ S1 protein - human foamy virus [Human foamy virus]